MAKPQRGQGRSFPDAPKQSGLSNKDARRWTQSRAVSRSGWAAIWTSLVLATAAIALPLYGRTARIVRDRDPFVYAQTGKEILAGRRLYKEAWIDKPPLALVMYAASQIVAPRSYRAIVLFGGLLIVAQGLLFANAFRHSMAASVASLLFVVLYPLNDLNCMWPSTEHFSNIFVTGTLLIGLSIFRERCFSMVQCLGSGVLLCAAFHVRQNAILCALFPILAVLVSGRPLRQRLSGLAAIVFGAMGTWAIVIALIARFGDVSGYFWTVFVHAQKYASAGNMRDLAALAWFFWNRPLAFLMMMYATLAADRRHFWLVALLVTVGLLGWMLPMRSYGHYWGSSLPYIALLIGLGTERLVDIRQLSWASPIALAATLIPSALLNEYQISTTSYLPYEGLAAAAERVAPKDSTLMVHGEMGAEAIQFGSRLPAANTYCWTFQMQSPWKDLFPIPWREIRDKYLASPPGVIVIHENELRIAAATQAPAEMPEYMELLHALLKSHRYNFVAKEGDYVIGIRGDQLNAEP